MDERTEDYSMLPQDAKHLIQVILPSIEWRQKIVICDRFVDSSLAYHKGRRRIGIPEIARINDLQTEGTEPGLHLVFGCRFDTGLSRIQEHRAYQLDRLTRKD